MENQIVFKNPHMEVLENGNLKHLAEWQLQYNGWLIRMDKGEISDGNSAPWLFRWLVPRFGRNTIGGVTHDGLYRRGTVIDVKTGRVIKITRRQADVIRLDLCIWCGCWWVETLAGYIGLRIGGRGTWNRYRHRDEK